MASRGGLSSLTPGAVGRAGFGAWTQLTMVATLAGALTIAAFSASGRASSARSSSRSARDRFTRLLP